MHPLGLIPFESFDLAFLHLIKQFHNQPYVIYIDLVYCGNALAFIFFTDAGIVQKVLTLGLLNAQKLIYSKVKTKKIPGGNTPVPPCGRGRPPPAPTPSTAFGRARSLRDRSSVGGKFVAPPLIPPNVQKPLTPLFLGDTRTDP